MPRILGVVVNPVAGIGGRVGLKGSDGVDLLREARQRGGESDAPQRTGEALQVVQKHSGYKLVTASGNMGEFEACAVGIEPTITIPVSNTSTTAKDTRFVVREMERIGVDLILFTGGDGTAQDIYSEIGERVPCLGIPAGVKMYSGVYAVNPRAAGQAAVGFLDQGASTTVMAEVMDIDNDVFKQGQISCRLYGYLRIPDDRYHIQVTKAGYSTTETDEIASIAEGVVERMDGDCLYILGPGTTVRAITEELGLEKTLLGIDVVLDRKLVATDASETLLSDLLKSGRPSKIIVTVIGGQGHIFGRGNQQLSPQVIRKVGLNNIIVVAAPKKLADLHGRSLRVDTGSTELDTELSGYIVVDTGRRESAVLKVEV